MSEQLLVSKSESARALGFSVRKLEQLISEHEISVRRVGRRVLIPRAELERFASGLPAMSGSATTRTLAVFHTPPAEADHSASTLS